MIFIGKIGEDDSDGIKKNFEDHNVDVSHLENCQNKPCGVALIEVQENGDNRIVVVPGANGEGNSNYL